jgi:hypothetical protein
MTVGSKASYSSFKASISPFLIISKMFLTMLLGNLGYTGFDNNAGLTSDSAVIALIILACVLPCEFFVDECCENYFSS